MTIMSHFQQYNMQLNVISIRQRNKSISIDYFEASIPTVFIYQTSLQLHQQNVHLTFITHLYHIHYTSIPHLLHIYITFITHLYHIHYTSIPHLLHIYITFITHLYHIFPTCFGVSHTIFRVRLRVRYSKTPSFTQLFSLA